MQLFPPFSRNKIFIVFFLFLFSSFSRLLAANPGQDPGVEAERTYKEFEDKRGALEKKKEKAPKIEMEKKEEKPSASKVTFLLKEIKIAGSVLYSPKDLLPLYQPYLNKKVSFQDLDGIVKTIEDKYARDGYPTTVAFLPEQDIKDGLVDVRVVEGKMGKLTIEGNKWFSSSLLEKYFHLKKNDALDIKKLQKNILRLNQSSDLVIKTLLSAGGEPGTSDITLRASEQFPCHLGVGFDNQGTRLTGRDRTSLFFRASNLTGNFDPLFINNIVSTSSFGESASYSYPLDTYGTKAGIDLTYFRMKLGKEYKAANIRGVTQIYNPYFLKELALTEDFQANAVVGVEIKSIRKKTDENLTTNDQLRLPYFSFNLVKSDSLGGETTFAPRFVFGTSHFLGASSRNHSYTSRAGTGGPFFKYEQALRRIQRFVFGSYLSMNSSFQAASRTLASSEQIQLGGINSIRGYPEGDYLADLGGNLSADWVFPMYLIPKDWKLSKSDTPLRHQIEPFLFFDVGGGKLKKTLTGEDKEKFLMGAGAGFQVRLKRNFYARLQWAKHLGDRPVGGAGPSTFYLTFQAEI